MSVESREQRAESEEPRVVVGPVTYAGRQRVTVRSSGVHIAAGTWRLALWTAAAAGIPETARVRESCSWGTGVADFDFSWEIEEPSAVSHQPSAAAFEAMPWEEGR